MLLMLTLFACITENSISYEQLKEAANHCTGHGETMQLLVRTDPLFMRMQIDVQCEDGSTFFCLGQEPGDNYGRWCKDRES